ncbi:hypothetical protein [Nesterenkonia sp.]|uniref:hypothetical protein n=1 Tax=Nesterenkonia sp. TaxID=704201 RepID=UPI0026378DC5|nr:hypothetical protein [Nesterenkonia sp.]
MTNATADGVAAVHQYLMQIRQRLEKSSKGPWHAVHHYDAALGRYVSSEVLPVAVHAGNGDGGMTNYADDKEYDDAEFIAHSKTDLQKLLMAVEAVLELHQPDEADTRLCAHCMEAIGVEAFQVEWPCPTVATIQEAIEGE